MNTAWVRAQYRKRTGLAAASTLCIYAIAFLGAWLIASLAPQNLSLAPSVVLVDLGGSGPPGDIPQGLPNAPDRPMGAKPGAAPAPAAQAAAPATPTPAAKSATKSAAVKESPAKAATAPKAAPSVEAPAVKSPAPSSSKASAIPEPKSTPSANAIPSQSAKAAVPPASSSTAPAAAQASGAQSTAAQAAPASAAAPQAEAVSPEQEARYRAAEAAAAEEAAAEAAAAPKTRTFGGSSSGAASGAPVTSTGGTGSAPGVAGGTGSVTYRGSEMGNALSTTFGSSSGTVGRNMYVPIYLYMPLPTTIDDSIYRNVPTKETFKAYYKQSGNQWVLKSQVPLAQRGQFWKMLEDAGLDASNADFKAGRKLSPVTLEFALGPVNRNRVELIDVRIVSSSGSSEIDEAVVYGFKQSTFYNKTGVAVGGRFTYEF